MVDEENSNRLQEESQQQQQQPSAPSSSYYRYKVTTGSLSEKTRYAYTLHINDFLAYFKIADIAPLQEYSPKLIKQMVKDYVLFLRDVRKLAHSSINLHVSAVAHFFHKIRDDDYRIDWSKAREEIPPDENIRRDRGYTVEEIQKMLSVCYRTREKVIIHLLESTGMRIGAIHSIRIADLSPKSTKQGKVYRIEVYARSSASYFAYCNTETAKTIDAYQKERTDAGETLMNDTPLIRNLYSSLSVKAKKKVSDSQIKNR
jgi:site-specific recombinase XerD